MSEPNIADETSNCEPSHMTPEQFRRYGHRFVDWVADYWSRLESLPVAPDVAPGAIRAKLPAAPPEQGEPLDGLLADVDEIVVPGLLHWQHPSYFGYFPGNASGPAVLGDILSGGLGVQGMMWSTSPAATEVEQHVLDWLAELLGLGDRFRFTSAAGEPGPGGGVIQDTGSSSTLVALLAAVHRATGGQVRVDGATDRYAVYASSEAHSSVLKAAIIAGLGERSMRMVDVDPDTLALDVEHLRRLVAADRAAGVTPVAVVATVGTTGTTAIDPVRAIGELCREESIWLHVDAAYAGAAAVCPELRGIQDGVAEYADSYFMDPHKWLLTNVDTSAFWIADREPLLAVMSVVPEYLRNPASEAGAVVDYRDWQVALGRRFRALKLWAVIRWYGAEGLRTHVRRGVALARQFAGWVDADDRFELVAPVPLSLVCFRLRGPDADNLALRDRLAGSGQAFLTHTKVAGRVVLRMAIGGTWTDQRHVEAAWRGIQDMARAGEPSAP